MPNQSIIWTVLPNGLTPDGRSVRLSVLVSPRLDPENGPAALRSFDDFLSWPKTLSGATFALRIGANTIALSAANFDRTIGSADEAAWSALFPPSTFVRPFTLRDRTNDTVVSYDTVAMHNIVADTYGKLAASAGSELPTLESLTADLKGLIDQVRAIDNDFLAPDNRTPAVGRLFDEYRNNKFKDYGGQEFPIGPFQMFHTPPNAVTTQTVTPENDPRLRVSWQHHKSGEIDAAKAVAELDFHQIAAAMNAHPALLRRLGLVIDFVVPRASVPQNIDLSLSMSVKFKSALQPTGAAARGASPVTHARHSASEFHTASRPTPGEGDLSVSGGLLKLAPDRFALLQADIDGAGHKLINFARTLSHHRKPERQVDAITKLPRGAGAPALRNAGLMLVHQNRRKALENSFARNHALNENITRLFSAARGAVAGLYAEDLIRGWRFDIWDKSSGKWRSLCERIGSYDVNSGAIVLPDVHEEGIVRLATTSSTDGTNPDLVFLHEALTVWNGWSLAAQQPGNAISTDDTKLRDAAAHVPEGVRLKTSFVPKPGSLPRLRYGRSYAIRARAVDLAGNSLPPSEGNYAGDDGLIAFATPYFRFEPVQPPTLALVGTQRAANAPLAGESMGLMAVRSFNAQFDDATPAAQEALRWAAAPRTSQREAELHSMLDGPEWGTPQQFAMLAERDNEIPQYEIHPSADTPLTGPIFSVPTPGARPPLGRGPLAGSEDPFAKEAPTATKYATMAASTLVLPYLPDPLCTSVNVRLFHHPLISAHTLIPVSLYRDGTKWPDVSPVLIRVYEDNNDVPRFDRPSHTLLIPTPKGTRATLRMSAALEDEALQVMGVWNWVPAADRTEQLTVRAKAGQLWPITPTRELKIVHAVQRPLAKPEIVSLKLAKYPAATSVLPTVVATVDRNTTDKVDFSASWHDAHDAGGTPAPVDQHKTALPFSIKITDPQGYAGILEHVVPDPTNHSNIAFGSVKPKLPQEANLIEPRVHEFGDTRYRRVEYQLVATSRFREFMPPDVLTTGQAPKRIATDANLKLEGTAKVAWIPSSASPPAPEVLYVVPTFGWNRGVDAEGKTTSWRRGGGLRVWLNRPWNASGYGEMLAVVLPPEGTVIDPNAPPFKHTVTQWGNDPIWKTGFVNGYAPREENFPLQRTLPDPTGAWLPPGAVASEADQSPGEFATQKLRHPGLPLASSTGLVDVVPHDVFWDADRRLWYCDIEIVQGKAYFPFVRLALARYQPCSLPQYNMSNVVLADFGSLAPNRWLTVSGSSPTRRGVSVYGLAPEMSSGYAEAFAARTQKIVNGKIVDHLPIDIAKSNVVEVWVEKLTAGQGEDFGWHKVATGVESMWAAQPATGVSASSGAGTRAPTGAGVTNRSAVGVKEQTRAGELVGKRQYDAVLKESLIGATFEWPSLWTGHIDLPTRPTATERYRVVVAEYEEYLADGADPYTTVIAAKARRLVFVEHVELT